MGLYSNGINGVALNTSTDLRAIETTATGAGSVVKLIELFLAGEASSSAVARVAVNRPGTAGITPTTGTADKLSPSLPNASFSFVTSWATDPVLAATDVLNPTFNAFGGAVRWVAPPGGEVVVGTQGAVANLSIRSRSGISTVSGHLIVEEA